MKKIFILLVLILIVAYFTNPKFEKHKEKIIEAYKNENTLTGIVGLGNVVANFTHYHDKYFFSYTTDPKNEEKITLGVFGFVAVLESLDIDMLKEKFEDLRNKLTE